MSTTVSYKGNTIATVDNNTKTLNTAGKYLEADVILTDVSQSGSTDFIITVSYNSTTQMWEPDKTFAEIQAANTAGKTIVLKTANSATVAVNFVSIGSSSILYAVHQYQAGETYHGESRNVEYITRYRMTSSALSIFGTPTTTVIPSSTLAINQNGTGIDVAAYASVDVNVSGGGTKNIQVNQDGGNVRTNGYTSTGVSLTVAKAGTYNVSWTAWRSSSQGTMGTNLYKNGTAGTNQQTWTSTYGQHIVLNNQTYAQGDVLTLYATAGSTSRYCYVGDLVIVEQ